MECVWKQEADPDLLSSDSRAYRNTFSCVIVSYTSYIYEVCDQHARKVTVTHS